MGFISILIVQTQRDFSLSLNFVNSEDHQQEVVMSKDDRAGVVGRGGDCGSGACTAHLWGQYSSAVAVKWSRLSTESSNFVGDLPSCKCLN